MAALEHHVWFAEGRTAEVFLRADGSVLKLMRDPDAMPLIEREAAALETVRQQGHLAPTVIEIVRVDGRPGLAMERIEGADLATLLGQRPWMLWRAARVMAEMHVAMHQCRAPGALPRLNDELRRDIESASALPSRLAQFALDALDSLPEGDRLCHGDFHLANIRGTWAVPVAIDWVNAASGDPTADVARTRLLHLLADPPPGTPRVARALLPVGRKLIVHRYMSVYRRLRPIDEHAVRTWEVVRAAARFNEGIESEHAMLARFLEQRLAMNPRGRGAT